MKLSDNITIFGGPATIADAGELDLFGFKLDGEWYVGHNEVAKTEEYGVVVNVVGLPEGGVSTGWVLLLG
jgi:hypothetical protein